MATPTSREELKQYALRKLGAPVIEINVDDSQLEDALDDSLQIFSEYHFDGVQKVFYKYELTSGDLTNGYIDIANIGSTGPNDSPQVSPGSSIVSVYKVFKFDESGSGTNFFSLNYQLALNDVYGIRAPGNMSDYYITQTYLTMLSEMLSPEKAVRFSRVTNRIYIDADLDSLIGAGSFLVIEAYAELDPYTYTEIYNDILLKRYVTASFRKQWGLNLIKYQGINLPGGVQFDGQALVSQGNEEMERIEETLQDKYELPADFWVG